MANFKTHFLTATAISGAASLIILATEIGTPTEVSLYFILGVVGGLLPDIDSDSSLPTKIFFSFLAFCFSFVAVLQVLSEYSLIELCIIWNVVFIFIRYGLLELFTRMTLHRGIFHSCLAVVFFTLLTVSFSYRFFGFTNIVSWINGFFLGLGYLVHLCLDEMNSVDLLNNRMKKSFGTALKLISIKNIKASFIMMILTFYLYENTPKVTPVWQKVSSMFYYYSAENRWVPSTNQWFTGLAQRVISFVDTKVEKG